MFCSVRKNVFLIFSIVFAVVFILSISLSRAQYYFGRNKIQYNQFDWQMLQTEHFNIYFYPRSSVD